MVMQHADGSRAVRSNQSTHGCDIKVQASVVYNNVSTPNAPSGLETVGNDGEQWSVGKQVWEGCR